MKAVLKTQSQTGLEVKDVPEPKVGDDEVLIKVKAAAICGSDLGIYQYTSAYSKMKLPVIMGHEFAGEISETGSSVVGFDVADRVLSESVKACGTCSFCREGRSNLCDDSTLFGIHTDGGFAEYVSVPYGLLHRIPDQMTYEEAALVEPLSNTIHFVRDVTPFSFGDFVVVQGCGPIGLFAAQLFKLGGARVLMSGLAADETRLEIAAKLGIETLNIDETSLEDRVDEYTNGVGADVALVAVGAPPAVRQAANIVKKRGTVTVVGIFGNKVSVDMNVLVRREMMIKGAYDARPANFPMAIELILRGDVNVLDLLTHKYPLEEAEEAFNVALNRTGGKIEFIPH
jgi:L-iditol 2-dehydrogenase